MHAKSLQVLMATVTAPFPLPRALHAALADECVVTAAIIQTHLACLVMGDVYLARLLAAAGISTSITI
jgi:hypothetical protein